MTADLIPPPHPRPVRVALGARPEAASIPDLTAVQPQRPVPRAGAFAFEEVNPMFEGQSPAEVEALIKSDPEFRQLYRHHQQLNRKVMDAELGVLPIDDLTLSRWKKEKLLAKDRLTRIFARTRH